jgi:hypothetical protein
LTDVMAHLVRLNSLLLNTDTTKLKDS